MMIDKMRLQAAQTPQKSATATALTFSVLSYIRNNESGTMHDLLNSDLICSWRAETEVQYDSILLCVHILIEEGKLVAESPFSLGVNVSGIQLTCVESP